MSTVKNIEVGKRTLIVAERLNGKTQFRTYWKGDDELRLAGNAGKNIERAKVVAQLLADKANQPNPTLAEVTERTQAGTVGTGRHRVEVVHNFTHNGSDYKVTIKWTPNANGEFVPTANVTKATDGRKGRAPKPTVADNDI